MSESRFTVVFAGNVRALSGNPHKIESPFGTVQTIDASDVLAENTRLQARIKELEGAMFSLLSRLASAKLNKSEYAAIENARAVVSAAIKEKP